MEINAQEVINRLSRKFAKAEAEKTVMEVQIEALQTENENLSAKISEYVTNSNPVDGEVIG